MSDLRSCPDRSEDCSDRLILTYRSTCGDLRSDPGSSSQPDQYPVDHRAPLRVSPDISTACGDLRGDLRAGSFRDPEAEDRLFPVEASSRTAHAQDERSGRFLAVENPPKSMDSVMESLRMNSGNLHAGYLSTFPPQPDHSLLHSPPAKIHQHKSHKSGFSTLSIAPIDLLLIKKRSSTDLNRS